MSFRGTTVVFFRRSDGKLIGYRSSGHTGYAEAGEDIVCAGVSALTQATLNGLEHILRIPCIASVDDQNARLECIFESNAEEELIERAQLLMQTLLEGLQAIQLGFPRNVRVIFKEWR